MILMNTGVASYCCSRYFGRGYGSYVYDDVACSSAETSLVSCNSRTLGSTNCAGSNDAGIGCYGKSSPYILSDTY